VKELVELIARALVDHPDEVRVTETAGEKTTVLELRVHPSDVGKIIGREGRTAQALRTVLNAASAKLGRRAVLEIID
jgi:uncharacterized protein